MDFPEFVSVSRFFIFSKTMNLFDLYEGKLLQRSKSGKIQYKSDNPLLPSTLVEKAHKTQKYNPLDFGELLMSIPTSFITFITRGLISPDVFVPALSVIYPLGAYLRKKPSAI
jgi:hypothetical protein